MTNFIVVVKEDCPTCQLIVPVLLQLNEQADLEIFSQDNPSFPPDLNARDDTDLARSWALRIETVPTLIRMDDEREVARTEGWDRNEWGRVSGVSFSTDIPDFRPGCGSRTMDPGMPEKLAVKFGGASLAARRLTLGEDEDDIEACFDRDWSDGLPVVPPTELRVARMLAGTRRPPDEVIGEVPPDYGVCTIEKVAINAVMAGCKPEYLPVVIAAVEAALMDEFCMHGLLATTYFSGPMIVVNGPLARAIGMNSRGNVLGQGNRANATIGRALQLVIRNVGGGKPG
ncbi:MAG: thioredoxin family protein, partial [Pseudomonadales bacterium]|nr:thioredoxin family protein [Pseudomonadales bacterium]